MGMRGFERAPQTSSLFSPLAITSVAVGVSALTFALLPWMSYAWFPPLGWISTVILVIGIPAALVGVITGAAALHGIGAAAFRSRPMARGGLIISIFALLLGIAWLVFFFTSLAGELERLGPPGGGESEKRLVRVVSEGSAREHL